MAVPTTKFGVVQWIIRNERRDRSCEGVPKIRKFLNAERREKKSMLKTQKARLHLRSARTEELEHKPNGVPVPQPWQAIKPALALHYSVGVVFIFSEVLTSERCGDATGRCR